MADYIISGATNPTACNGDYNLDGSFGGKPRFKHATQDYWIWWTPALFMWLVASNNGGGDWLFERDDENMVGAYVPTGGSGDVVVTMDSWPAPTITQKTTPYQMYRNSTIDALLPGTGFKPGIVAVEHRYHVPTVTDITVNTTTYISPTSIRLNMTGGASTKQVWHAVKVTNPDGQNYTRELTTIFGGTDRLSPSKPTIATDPISPSDIILTITPVVEAVQIAGYRIEWQNPSGGAWSILHYNTGIVDLRTSFSVKALWGMDLSGATTYKFRVRTIANTAQQSPWSDEQTGTTESYYALGKPTGLTEVSKTDTTIAVSWTAPTADPPDTPAATDYQVNATDISVVDGETITATVGGTGTSKTISGLNPLTEYRITVAAINAGGVGTASDPLDITTSGNPRYALTFSEQNTLEGVAIFLYSDSGRTALVGTLSTDAAGEASIDFLDGTYYWSAEFGGYYTELGSATIDGAAEAVPFTMDLLLTEGPLPLYRPRRGA